MAGILHDVTGVAVCGAIEEHPRIGDVETKSVKEGLNIIEYSARKPES